MVLISSLASTSWGKPRYRTLHTFKQTGASLPFAGLVADLQGNLYGTTAIDGDSQYGTVFKLTPNGHGGWKETLLHIFSGRDGDQPTASVIFDAAGNLYGTTGGGGDYGLGTAFELAPVRHGDWTEAVLHSFNAAEGIDPTAGLILDAGGNLYGTTYMDGPLGGGTVFKLAPNGHGGWKETVLHSFNGADGGNPRGSLIFDADGNLYGTTTGGFTSEGTVFELAPNGHGGWKHVVLHSFNGADGSSPSASLIFDTAGNLYGTTPGGGTFGWGTVFELAPDGRGDWNETVLHSFRGKDGQSSFTGLVFDADGNLYGTTIQGGAFGQGTVFELAPDGHGGWKETVLHSFKDRPGSSPLGTLIFGPQGHLYGTTNGDQRTTWGSVFEITP